MGGDEKAINKASKALIDAAETGDVDTPRVALAAGTDMMEWPFRALHQAVMCNHIGVVKLLFDAGIDVGMMIHRVAQVEKGRGYQEMVALLVEHGAKLEEIEDDSSIVTPKSLPFLQSLCWQREKVSDFTQAKKLARYESGWQYLEVFNNLGEEEREFIRQLAKVHGSWLIKKV